MSGGDTFTHDQKPCLGILLTNLGTPDAPNAKEVSRYLAEFLWDPRVVELPRPLWWLILHGVILRIRPARSASKYQQIWTPEGSPLLAIAQRQAAAVAKRLTQHCPGPVKVALGMRYGNPSIATALHELRDAGVRRLLVFPLYPQYSAATTASTFDAIARELMTWRWLPEWRMINHYHDEPEYIGAIADSVMALWGRGGAAERLLFSFHGMPKRSLLSGDPYHCECHKTARLVAEHLELAAPDWGIAFQSRFGREEWLKPYTSDVLKEWAKAGVNSVDVICPGFSADCLETLEEINEENRELFLKAGGKQFRYIPSLNDSDRHIAVLVKLILTHCGGWPEVMPEFDAMAAAKACEATRMWAQAMGAER